MPHAFPGVSKEAKGNRNGTTGRELPQSHRKDSLENSGARSNCMGAGGEQEIPYRCQKRSRIMDTLS